MEIHGSPNDSWVLNPIPFSRNKISTLKSPVFVSPASLSPLSNSTMMFASPSSPTDKCRKSHGRSTLWRATKQFLACYSISKRRQKSSKDNSINMRTSPLPSPDHSYSAMNAEERDENLKAAITYCNKSMKSERREDAMFKNCIPGG